MDITWLNTAVFIIKILKNGAVNNRNWPPLKNDAKAINLKIEHGTTQM